MTDDTVLDQLDAAVSTLRQKAHSTNARLACVDAELAALYKLTDTLAAPRPRESEYARCLFCDADYGLPSQPRAYDKITAACGCTGVGWKCADGYPPSYGGFKNHGCNSLQQTPLPKCYKCNERQRLYSYV